jgi:hypothetical protein
MPRREVTKAELAALGPGPHVYEPAFRRVAGYGSRQGFWKARRRGDIPPAIRLGSKKPAWPIEVVIDYLATRPAA